jgi:hypothetical protein
MELAKVEALASGHRADFERERADVLMAELLKMTADAMAAKEAAARLEGVLVRLHQELSDVHSDRDAWRSDAELTQEPPARCSESGVRQRGQLPLPTSPLLVSQFTLPIVSTETADD